MAERVPSPVSLFANIDLNAPSPLPEPHYDAVYHYTSASAAMSVVEKDELWASHIATMNDAEERLYGWRLILGRMHETQADYDPRFAFTMADMVDPLPQDANAYVVSASRLHDDLSQFRAYGHYELAIAGGYWFAPDYPDAPDNAQGWAVWRPVVYGPEEANVYIDRVLRALDEHLTKANPPNPRQRIVQWVDYLAGFIKHPAFKAEQEVRLLLHGRADTLYVRTHIGGGRIVPHVIMRPAVDGVGCLRGLHLGPGAGGEVAAIGAQALLAKTPYLDMKPTLSVMPLRG